MSSHPVVIIGGGINGLTCAAFLAKAGVAPIVLERLDAVGGGARTAEIAPGFRGPILSHSAGPFRGDIIDELHLASHGLEFVRSEVSVAALGADKQVLTLYEDPKKTAKALRAWSPNDAEAWPAVCFVRCVTWSRHQHVVCRHAARRSTNPQGETCGRCSGRCERSAPSTNLTRIACCVGDQWRSPISSANASSTSACARPSRLMASLGRASVRGRPGAASSCCCAPPTRPSDRHVHGLREEDRERLPPRSSAWSKGAAARFGPERRCVRSS